MTTPNMILIMDGYGLNQDPYGNAMAAAHKPALDALMGKYPGTSLLACGPAVGLPEGQMGNSEVGHLNIGGGRIVYQEFTRISKAIETGSFFENRQLMAAMDKQAISHGTLHIMGLLSDGGVHSHISHLAALLEMAAARNVENVKIHCFLDGRDTPPRSAETYLKQLDEIIRRVGTGQVATIAGRYYAMDRDQRWERVSLAYNAIADAAGEAAASALEALHMAYARGEDDEFVRPTVIGTGARIKEDDSIILFNFRPDRVRELSRALTDAEFDGFDRKQVPNGIFAVSLTEYDPTLTHIQVAFPPERIQDTLGQVVSNLGMRQLRMAETEKYAHVTFFFNGGVEEPNPGEDRVLIPSPKVATYDLQPEMSAYLVTEELLRRLEENVHDLIILNFANADMVGHTGVFDAAVKAIETLDACVPRIADAVLARGGQILLTADHGNADCMLDEEGNVVTAHSLNPVPLIHISKDPKELMNGGVLADISPTLLDLMGIPIPEAMTGRSLVKK